MPRTLPPWVGLQGKRTDPKDVIHKCDKCGKVDNALEIPCRITEGGAVRLCAKCYPGFEKEVNDQKTSYDSEVDTVMTPYLDKFKTQEELQEESKSQEVIGPYVLLGIPENEAKNRFYKCPYCNKLAPIQSFEHIKYKDKILIRCSDCRKQLDIKGQLIPAKRNLRKTFKEKYNKYLRGE